MVSLLLATPQAAWLEPRWEGPRRDVPVEERVPRIIAIPTAT